jgi:spermidine synthase
MHVGVVGLGTGTLASYAAAGDRMRFYEIDPGVVTLSRGRDPTFSYLRDTPARVDVVLGDARMRLEREPPQGFDVLVVDAFSSDAIPVHLLTVEALHGYVGHLRGPDAILALHISNRYLDLDPVVRGAADALGLAVLRVADRPADEVRYSTSDWMLLATDEAAFAGILEVVGTPEPPSRPPPWPRWTDEYTNLLDALE